MDKMQRKRLVKEAFDVFKAVSDCLYLYYKGRPYMFKPIAGQLRILYCDTNRKKENSLLHHLYPELKLLAFRNDEYSESQNNIRIIAYGMDGYEIPNALKIKEAGYSIIEDKDGIAYPDIDLAEPPIHLSLEQWRNQIIDDELNVTVKDVIRTIADKGGGAHVDIKSDDKLLLMRRSTPAKIDYQVLFIIALARYTIRLANNLCAEWKKEFPDIIKI
jgi:hypothetical protein